MDWGEDVVTISDEGSVRTIGLNRPDALNAFNNPQYDALADALIDAAGDAGVKAVVLTGNGRAFSAGADLAGRSEEPPKHGFAGLIRTIVDFEKPFVLAINGLGVGIGATICGLADFAFMAESARLRCPFSTLGLVAEAGSTMTFPALMGRQRAMWMLMASEWMTAAQCKEWGLVLDVFPDEGFLAAVEAKAATFAALPSDSLASAKRLIIGPHKERLLAVVDAENEALAALSGGPANREAIAAFREKRAADFSHL